MTGHETTTSSRPPGAWRPFRKLRLGSGHAAACRERPDRAHDGGCPAGEGGHPTTRAIWLEHRVQRQLRWCGEFRSRIGDWFYDIGTGYGTGEHENTTSSTNNVCLDGNGHLVLKAINNGGTWTSARIESTRDDFQAPPGGKLEMTAEIQQPNVANGTGYWPAF